MVSDREWDEMVLVGIVARTHGNKGQVILNSETDFPDLRFREGAMLFTRVDQGPVEPLTVASVRIQQGRPIVGLIGIGTIDQAERFAGVELRVPQSEQLSLPDGSYYHHQLIGCEVRTTAGEVVGQVSAVQGEGQATRLVVQGRRAEILIPFAQELCEIDVPARTIVVNPPAGLLEVNGDWR